MPSALKERFVDDLTAELRSSEHVLLADYQGLNSEELTELRGKLKKAGARFKVVKNRLARISFKNRGWDLDAYMTGPSAIAYNGEDSVAITKVLADFGKGHKALKLKAGFIFGEVADFNKIRSIADLPSRDVLIATLAATLNSPLQKLAATLGEPLRSLHAALSDLAKKKESQPA